MSVERPSHRMTRRVYAGPSAAGPGEQVVAICRLTHVGPHRTFVNKEFVTHRRAFTSCQPSLEMYSEGNAVTYARIRTQCHPARGSHAADRSVVHAVCPRHRLDLEAPRRQRLRTLPSHRSVRGAPRAAPAGIRVDPPDLRRRVTGARNLRRWARSRRCAADPRRARAGRADGRTGPGSPSARSVRSRRAPCGGAP